MHEKFKLDARSLERKFKRRITKVGYIRTATGKVNSILDYNSSYLLLKTESRGGQFDIARKALRKAIAFVYFKRTVIRKDMQPFSNYSSAIFSILHYIFQDVSRIQKLKNGLLSLSLKGTRSFLSGCERSPGMLKIISELNGKFVLFNFLQLRGGTKWLEYLEEYNLFSVIDSGAYTLHQQKQKQQKNAEQLELLSDCILEDMTLEGYAAFINKYKDHPRIFGFFPLDVIGDPIKTKENYKKLSALTNANIFPVWQFTDSISELDKLVKEEHELICVGGTVPYLSNRKEIVRNVLDKIFSLFPTTNFHFLGGANEMLVDFPWFSTDTTAYLNARKSSKQRKVYLENGHRVDAPEDLSVEDIIKQNLSFLIELENRNSLYQICLTDF
ncbi:hypothetical protein ACFFIX_19740 [Metabacillus herbersteinensis]|uniref:Uncharacterized protein n=1 Tax=Metabacillus herbersteinensis TaxID=283816 RepID=A0ABV6GJJ0_9BACI